MDEENRGNYQLECKLEFWWFEHDASLALLKQK
jgi:hypothetical protein